MVNASASLPRPRRGVSRWSTLLHLGVAAVMVIVLVPLVLKAAQAAPPAIAEFAPQVQQTIQKAPPGQNSVFGAGGYSTPTPTPSPTPTAAAGPGAVAQATPTPVNVPAGARVNKCIGSPPRQVEDPQSPPCVPFYDTSKGNGGATAFGVTATAINVTLPSYIAANAGDYATIANFFNDRFEFYGRKLVVKPFTDHGALGTPDGMAADAATVETMYGKDGTFAEMGYPPADGGEHIFYDDLATQAHPVIGIQGAITSLPIVDQAHLASHAPYEWNYVQTPDIIERNLADMICKQLIGHNATHAGAPSNSLPRKIGILRGVRAGTPAYDVSVLQSALQGCAGTVPSKDFSQPSNTEAAEVATALEAYSQQGITSIFCACFSGDLEQYVMPGASGQNYHPEWLTSDIGDQDGNESLYLGPQDQVSHAVGIRSKNKELPTLDMPYIWAIHYESPNNPKPPYDNTNNAWEDWVYDDMLLLASGIQMAGPNLTPQTFAAALQRTEFPNPGCDGPPYYQACVGFQGGSYSMQRTFAPVWWDLNQKNPDLSSNNPGAYCYVGRGPRYALGSWPAADGYQKYPCN